MGSEMCIRDRKWVGSHGLHYSQLNDAQRFAHLPPPNMYGVYSQPGKDRGSLDDWHIAMGYPLNTFSKDGLIAALPLAYGRVLAPQMAAAHLHRNLGCPVLSPRARSRELMDAINRWSRDGYTPASNTAPLRHGPIQESLTMRTDALLNLDATGPLRAETDPDGYTYFVRPSCGGRPSNSGKGVTGGLGGCKSSIWGLVGTMVPLVK